MERYELSLKNYDLKVFGSNSLSLKLSKENINLKIKNIKLDPVELSIRIWCGRIFWIRL